jgi:adenine-specific DNA-methyltransferase
MNKRTILQSLSRSVLLETARTFEVPGLSNKKREDIVDALMRIRSLPVEDILVTLQVGDLKDICREFEIKPESWRKDAIIKVLSAEGDTTKPQKVNASVKLEKKTNTIEVVTRKEKPHMARNNSGNQKDIEQYTHESQDRLNNPPVGLVTPDTDKDLGKKQYQYDPHLDPQLVWAGKAEHTSFEVPTVSLHVHERIDSKRIIEQVRKEEKQDSEQMSLFATHERPLREAVEFYKHKDGWTNRLVAGDSLLVMNSLIEKEGMGEKVQMVYFDPPYGIKYGSNFQPFVNKRDVKDGKDDDLSSEPESIRAFRDTWELGIHSYLSYLRDRLFIAKKILNDSGCFFLQMNSENVAVARLLLEEVFGPKNFVADIVFRKKSLPLGAKHLETMHDHILMFAKDREQLKYRPLFQFMDEVTAHWRYALLPNNEVLKIKPEEFRSASHPKGTRYYRLFSLIAPSYSANTDFIYTYKGKQYHPPSKGSWVVDKQKLDRLASLNRLEIEGNSISYRLFFDDFPYRKLTNLWLDVAVSYQKIYAVQTTEQVITRCMHMATDPGDLVLDITCGSGTTAAVSEQWGRRWITCDTSRVAVALAKQRLMTAGFDFYELAQPSEGIASGFDYKTVPHITLKSIANNEPPAQQTLYDHPLVDNKKKRVTGPFTVEAVPAPTVKSFDDIETEDTGISDTSVTRSGETRRQSEWRQELLKTGVRGKNGQFIKFNRIEPMSGTLYIQAEGETIWCDAGANTVREAPKGWKPQKVLICFGPEHAPLEQRTVEMAWQEARP